VTGGELLSQARSTNDAKRSARLLGTNKSRDAITEDFVARVCAYYQRDIIDVTITPDDTGILSLLTTAADTILTKLVDTISARARLNLTDNQRQLMKAILEQLHKRLNELSLVDTLDTTSVGEYLTKSCLIVTRQYPRFIAAEEANERYTYISIYHASRLIELVEQSRNKALELAQLWDSDDENCCAKYFKVKDGTALMLSLEKQIVIGFSELNADSLFNTHFSTAFNPERALLGNVHRPTHERFNRIWSALKTDFLDYLKQHTDNEQLPEIWLTGQGIGGAVAVLVAAAMLLEQPTLKIYVHTFARTVLGDQAFKTFVETSGLSINNWIILHDTTLIPADTIEGYVGIGETIPLRINNPVAKKYTIKEYQQGVLEHANSLGISVPTMTDEDEFRKMSEEISVVDERLISDVNSSVSVSLPTPSQLTDRREAKDSIAAIQKLLIDGRLQSIQALDEYCAILEEISKEIHPKELAYTRATELEKIFLHPNFRELSLQSILALLKSYENFLLFGFIHKKGLGYKTTRAELIADIKQALPLPIPAAKEIYISYKRLSALLAVLRQQFQKNDVMLYEMIAKLYSLIEKQPDIFADKHMDILKDSYSLFQKHPLIPYADAEILLFIFLSQFRKPDARVISWVQRLLWAKLRNSKNTTKLAEVGFEYLLTQFRHTNDEVLRDKIIMGTKDALGLRYWYEDRELASIEYLLEITAQQTDAPLLKAFIVTSDAQSQSELGRFGDLLAKIIASTDTTPLQRLRCLCFQHYLKGLYKVKITAADYIALAQENNILLNRPTAIRAYMMAIRVMEEEKCSTQEQTPIRQVISTLYCQDGDDEAGKGNKINAINAYYKAVEFDGENKLALKALFDLVMNNVLQELTHRLYAATDAASFADEEERHAALKQGSIIIEGIFGGTRILKPEFVKDLLDGYQLKAANIIEKDGTRMQQGQHVVAKIGLEQQEIYLKQNATSSGLAMAATTFFQVLFGMTGSIPCPYAAVEPLQINYLDENGTLKTLYVQATAAVAGEDLDIFLAKPREDLLQEMDKINKTQLGALIFSNQFLQSEDNRAPNWKIRMLPDGSYVFEGYDNDHILVKNSTVEQSGFISRTVNRPVVKDVFYCFPQVQEDFDEAIIDNITNPIFTPLDSLKIWMHVLRYYNQGIAAKYKDKAATLFEQSDPTKPMMLEALISPVQLGRMYLKLRKLKYVIQQGQLKMIDVLSALDNTLGHLYKSSFEKWPHPTYSPQERFTELTAGLFTPQGGTMTTNAGLIKLVVGKVVEKYSELTAQLWQPEGLLHLLIAIDDAGLLMKLVIEQLYQGHLSLFEGLSTLGRGALQQSILAQLSFDKFPDAFQTSEFFRQIFDSIDPTTITKLMIINNSLMKDNELIGLIKKFTKLTELKLQGCAGIQGKATIIFIDNIWSICFKRKIHFSHINCNGILNTLWLEAEERAESNYSSGGRSSPISWTAHTGI